MESDREMKPQTGNATRACDGRGEKKAGLKDKGGDSNLTRGGRR